MKRAIATALILVSGVAAADQYVNGCTRRDGTYVQPHMRSDPDQYHYNNYSAKATPILTRASKGRSVTSTATRLPTTKATATPTVADLPS